jgi:hypothetical protein
MCGYCADKIRDEDTAVIEGQTTKVKHLRGRIIDRKPVDTGTATAKVLFLSRKVG